MKGKAINECIEIQVTGLMLTIGEECRNDISGICLAKNNL